LIDSVKVLLLPLHIKLGLISSNLWRLLTKKEIVSSNSTQVSSSQLCEN